MRKQPIIVVVIQSLSYTGTTWINLVLGCHTDALAIGPLHRILRLKDNDPACRVHGHECSFWPDFLERYNENESVFIQLADHTGKNVFIINNPLQEDETKHINHPDIWVKRIRVVRDARGVFASWLRVHPEASRYREKNADIKQAILDFKPWIDGEFQRIDPQNEGVLLCRYEDVLANKSSWLRIFSEFIGITYDSQAFRYWEHDIHPTAGNQGTISLIKFAKGIPVPEGYRDRKFYHEQYERAISDQPFQAEKWKDGLPLEAQYLLSVAAFDYQTVLGYSKNNHHKGIEEETNQKINTSTSPNYAKFKAYLAPSAKGIARKPGTKLNIETDKSAKAFEMLKRLALPIYKRLPIFVKQKIRQLVQR